MESELERVGRYRLLHYQPSPETGERITVGIVFEDSRHAFLVYDEQFRKLRKLYPWIDASTLAFCLEDLKRVLAKSEGAKSGGIELVLHLYGPQLVPSEARKVTLPVTETMLAMLMEKFVYPLHAQRAVTEDKPRDPVAVAIEAFVKNRTQDLRFHAQATAQTILGRRMAGIRPVALAVEGESGWTLIDGVDLNVMTPHQAMKRADEVGKTFWQYSRLLDGPQIQTVGVVLNGQSHVEAKTHEAHDYALHRLKMDADSAIDGASSNSTADLEKALALPHTFQ